MLVRSGPGADTLFLGTGSGVLRYVEMALVGVDPPTAGSPLVLRVHPNPFDEVTTVAFHIPRASRVSLRVFDATGREEATLL